MHDILELFKSLTNADWIIAHGGLYIVMLIIFAETGLFVGFFLPGDSILFITGTIIGSSALHQPFDNNIGNLLYWMAVISVAGIIGNMVGYWFGKKSGHLLFERRDTFLFKRKHLLQAQEFYEKRGGMAIILARFLPIVRTFAPIVAGIVKMNYKKFFLYNVIGSIAWVVSMIFLGFILGKNAWVQNNLEKVIIILILVTTAPVLFKMFFSRKKTATASEE